MQATPSSVRLREAVHRDDIERKRLDALGRRVQTKTAAPLQESPIRHAWLDWRRLLEAPALAMLDAANSPEQLQRLIDANQSRLAMLGPTPNAPTVLLRERSWRLLLDGHLLYGLRLAEQDQRNALNAALDRATDFHASLRRQTVSRRFRRATRSLKVARRLADAHHVRLLTDVELSALPLPELSPPSRYAYHVLPGARWRSRYAIAHVVQGTSMRPLCGLCESLVIQPPSRTTSFTACPHCQARLDPPGGRGT